MASVNLSTVAAKKGIDELRDRVKRLGGDIKGLESIIRAQQLAGMKGEKLQQAQTRQALSGTKEEIRLARAIEAQENRQSAQRLRQSQLIFAARQRMLDQLNKLRIAGADAGDQQKVQGAFNRFSTQVSPGTRGVRSSKDLQRAGQEFTGSIKSSERRLKALSAAAKKTSDVTHTLASRLRNVGSSAIFAVGPLSGIGARLNAFTAIVGRTSIASALFAAGLVAVIVVLVKMTTAIARAGIEFTKQINVLKIATGGAALAAKAYRFVEDEAIRLGTSMKTSVEQFGQLAAAAKGTALAGAGVRDIFTAVSEASSVLQLSTEQTTGAFRAIQQMISKGSVQSEELRGQLGERLPGAFQIAARAMDVTTSKLSEMLEQGKIAAEDFLPKFAKELRKTFGPGVVAAAGSATAEFNRFTTAIGGVLLEMDKLLGISTAVTAGMSLAASATISFRNALRTLSGVTGTAAKIAEVDKEILFSRTTIAGSSGLLKATEERNLLNLLRIRQELFVLRREEIKLARERFQIGGLFKEAELNRDILGLLKAQIMAQAKLSAARGSSGSNTIRAVDAAEARLQATDIVAGIPERDRTSVSKQLTGEGFGGSNLTAQIAAIISSTKDAKAKLDSLLELVKSTPEAFRSATKSVLDMNEELRALSEGSDAVKELEEAFDKRESLMAYKNLLDDMTDAARANVLTIDEFGEKLVELSKARKKAFGDEAIRDIEMGNKVLSLRVRRMGDAADALEFHNKLQSEFAGKILPAQIKQLSILHREQEKLNLQFERQEQIIDTVRGVMEDFGGVMVDSFVDAIAEGKKFDDVLHLLIKDIAKLALQKSLTSIVDTGISVLLNNGGGGGGTGGTTGGGGLGGIISSVLRLFSGRALGGPVSTGKSFVVGERGPEIFTPHSAGTITPEFGGTRVFIDARGADPAAITRLEQALVRMNMSIEPRAVGAVQEARARDPRFFG